MKLLAGNAFEPGAIKRFVILNYVVTGYSSAAVYTSSSRNIG
jgi:hypothetical protein